MGPFGPDTALNRPGFGPGSDRPFIVSLSKMPQGRVILGAMGIFCVISAIPQYSKFDLYNMKHIIKTTVLYNTLCFLSIFIIYIQNIVFGSQKPPTMTPEYEAATRAYMRYHNMNP